jgi:hypothetical protein
MNLARRMEPVVAVIGLVLIVGPVACSPRVHVDPIEVKPIHIVHDINIRVDKQLDEFFAFQEQGAATTQPATNTAASTTQTAAGDVR